jgi:hypothetical protein
MTPTVESVRAALREKYPAWDSTAPAERRLLCMAYLADQIKVRESGGNNRGAWVEAFLRSVGLGPGYAWCAAAVNFASLVAEAPCPKRPESNPAAVIGWRSWARKRGYLVDAPKRGDIAMHRTTADTGHIGVVVKVIGPLVYSIEGNTSAGEDGSQRDGGGLYRRVRTKGFWSWGFARI